METGLLMADLWQNRWESMLSGSIFFKNLSTWEYMLTVRPIVYLIPVTLKPPSSFSTSKPHYLSPTCSTTLCHKNWPSNIETRNKKKKKIANWDGNLMISSTLSIYSINEWRQTLEMGLGDVLLAPSLYMLVWSWINKLDSVADTQIWA